MTQRIERELQISKPLRSIAREATLNIYRTDIVLTEALEKALAPVELQLDEYNVMRIVRGAGDEGHERGEIERRMVHPTDRLLAILHRLRSRGLVRGSRRIVITPSGQELLAVVDPEFEAVIEERVGWIPEERLRIAIEVMEQIRLGPGATGSAEDDQNSSS